MNLHLSRLCLNPLFAPALKLAADPYQLHAKLLATLPCGPKAKPPTDRQPKTADLLFRVDETDHGPDVLIQTLIEPDWPALELAPRAYRQPPETKLFNPEIAPGQRLAFRLLCLPAVRKSGQFGVKSNGKRAPGPRHACRDDTQRLEWLRRKADENGFAVESAGLTLLEWRSSKPLQAQGGNAVETHQQARDRAFGFDRKQRLGAVRFDGVLQVTDPGKLLLALCGGIGPQKAYGFGLLSLAPTK